MNFVLALLIGLSGVFYEANFIPDFSLTPGAVNAAVTQGNIQKTICKPGYTSTIRPSSSYTTALKIKQLSSGYAVGGDQNPSHYEEDHLISLEIGGSPKSTANLWPEYYDSPLGARVKDLVENKLHALVCSQVIPLKTAQFLISHDWISAYASYVKPLTSLQVLFMNPGPLPSANPLITGTPIATPTPSASNASPTPAPLPSSSPSASPAVTPTPEPVVSKTPTPQPTPIPSPSQTLPTISAGAFCSTNDAGKKGIGSNGSTYTCKVSATDSKLRWRI